MTVPDTYIHGTEPGEQQRLAALNRLTNRAFIEFLDIRPGMQILEVGSGLGLLAADVASEAANVQVVGLERSSAQIAAAVVAANVRYVQGDAHSLEFEDESFDLVYARYLLEHVPRPAEVLKEMRRVARTGARVAACENDISLLRLDPPCPAFERVWQLFQEHQHNLGGNSHIGRSLYRLFRRAGLSHGRVVDSAGGSLARLDRVFRLDTKRDRQSRELPARPGGVRIVRSGADRRGCCRARGAL